MSERKDTNNWHSKQSWIKDALSKSGTDLMEISVTQSSTASTTYTAKNGAAKKGSRKNGEELPSKMVYHQPTPLIVKKEQSSQAQFCTPLRTTAADQFDHLNIQTHAYGGGSSLIMQEQRQAPPSSITLAQIQQGLKNVPNQTFLNAIKAELLPPSITLYPTSTNHAHNPASAAPVLPSMPLPTPAPSLVPSSTTTPSTKAATATSARSGAIPPTTTTQKGRGKSGANKTQFKCDQCGMTFGSKSAHTSHTKSHAKSGDLIDNGLDMSAMHSIGLELNEAGVPLGIPKTPQIKPNAAVAGGGDPYQCNVCQKTFAVPARLIRHYRTHTGERPFECEFCHKLFSVKENLQVHRRIHTKERPYKCEVCGRAFEHSGKLHRHMRIHTGERPHKCSVCEKTFIQSGQLVIHMRTHTGEKPYKCPVEGCGKGFTCSKQLKVHSRTHTGEKPYHCDICFRDFGYNHVLKLHRVQHYGSKCYKCTICDETFKSKKEMEAHIKGHANELPDDEEDTAGVSGTSTGGSDHQVVKASSSSSSASSGESMSPPASPLSSVAPRAHRRKQNAQSAPLGSPTYNVSPTAPLSPTSSLTSAAASHFSAGSPSSSSVTSPTMSLTIETDHHSHDSGVVSTSSSSTMRHQATALGQASTVVAAAANDEMPTDLSVQQEHQHQSGHHTHPHHHRQQQPPPPPPPPPMKYYQLQTQQASPVYHEQTPLSYATTYHRDAAPEQMPQPPQPQQQTHYAHSQQSDDVTPPTHDEPTISPALLEAASIRRALMEPREEQETQAALQILQLKRSHQHQQHQQQQQQHYQHLQQQHNQHQEQQGNAMTQYDDAQEANELIEHYKRGELAQHGIHKGYAPVPKFEQSLLNNETIVRQVEAAIAPLRSSTESPERSSSPESDSMMMADRDVMTLPLRKRKLYMSQKDTSSEESSATTGGATTAENLSGSGNCDVNAKVMRMSSVIQFAKAS